MSTGILHDGLRGASHTIASISVRNTSHSTQRRTHIHTHTLLGSTRTSRPLTHVLLPSVRGRGTMMRRAWLGSTSTLFHLFEMESGCWEPCAAY
jgi:hypothetical protein